MDDTFNTIMTAILKQAQDKLYTQIDELRKQGVEQTPCSKCHKPTPLDDLRPKVLADIDLNGPLMVVNQDTVELGMCCPACVKDLDSRKE